MPVGVLDYPKAKLYMAIDSEIEETYRLHACAKEPWTTDWIERIPQGGILWDIGANVGSYTLLAAHLGLPVIAVEPQPETFGRLAHNLFLNHFADRVVVIHGACGKDHGFEWLHMGDMRPGASKNVIGEVSTHVVHKMRIVSYPLDVLMQMTGFDAPYYLKLDVDGTELDVLAGGAVFLDHVAGAMVEMAPQTEAECTAIMASHGLKVLKRWDTREGKPMGIAYAEFGR